MRRRRWTLRRLFFFSALFHMASAAQVTLAAQQVPDLRILERQVRLTLDEGGEYRVIDAMRVRLAAGQPDSLAPSLPLPLVVLQEEAVGARGLGGDLSPRQVVRDGNHLTLVGAIPRPVFEVGATYRLPSDVRSLVLRSAAAVDELSVFVDRGRIAVRPEGGLARQEDVGSPSQPSLNYVAANLPADSEVRIAIISRRTGWRERFAVLIATLFAAGVAGIWVWRRAD
ncbi:MAG: hypothetical protein PVJ64_15055 [Gemmatimonadales bacterium]